ECWEQLVRRSQEIPSLKLYADAAHAGYLALRGNISAALPRWESLVERCAPKEHVGWISIRLNYADALNAAGQHARAREIALNTLEHVTPAELELGLPYVEAPRQLALAEAGLGNYAEAVRILDGLLAQHGTRDQPLILGLFHKARAQVARAMADKEAFSSQLAAMERLFHGTNNPSLIAQCEQLARAGVEAGLSDPAAFASSKNAEYQPAGSGLSGIDRLLLECRNPEERWDRALQMVIEKTGAQRASLYLLRAGDLHLVATEPEGEPPAEIVVELSMLVAGARDRYESSRDEAPESTALDDEDASDPDSEPATLTVLTHADERQIGPHQLFVLSTLSTGALRVIGGMVVSSEAEAEAEAGATLGRDALNGIARALWEAGDVSTSSGESSLRR
ncbi:MAG TPA: hypothetical protein VK524_01580, partial [Polyangiaceae bacterium]|nr:hypothetical protein [Polyangiaceae bacterium]